MLYAYSDSDFAGDADTRRSRTGAVVFMNSGPVIWVSKRQNGVTLSSTEAEFVAANSATTSVVWTRNLLEEVGVPVKYKVDLYMDNQSAIRLIKNPEFHQRTKHIDIKFKYVREKYEEGMIDVHFVKSEEQIADIFTKALSSAKFQNFCALLNLNHV